MAIKFQGAVDADGKPARRSVKPQQDTRNKDRMVYRVGAHWEATDGLQYFRIGDTLHCSDGRSWSGVTSDEAAAVIARLDI